MEFKFETTYDQKATTAMAKVLRKTVRRKRSRFSHILGICVIALSLLLVLPLGNENFTVDSDSVVTWLVIVVLTLVLLFEDRINGYIARKRLLPGLDRATVIFRENGYCSETAIGTSEFRYNNITMLVETADYFVFVFGKNHAQVYDKNSMTGGTTEAFREFIKQAAGMDIQTIR